MELTTKHYAVLATFLIGLSTQLVGLHGWADIGTPSFIGGTLGMLGSIIAAVFVGSPLKNGNGLPK